MNEDSMETTDRFIIDTTEYIRKKNKKRVDKPTIINCVFNKSINVDKQVVEKRITFLTTYGTLENKPNGNKRQSWYQMMLLIILQQHQKSSTLRQEQK